MIKAVFLDWSNTLARYTPSREELQSQALREFGINSSPQEITPGLFSADKYLFEETAVSPVWLRSRAEQGAVYTRYQQLLLSEIGVAIPKNPDFFPKLLMKLNELYKGMKFALFDDVLPTLKTLRTQQTQEIRSLVLALVTNMDSDMRAVCREFGLDAYLDFVLTSSETGASKPDPRIFLTALERAGVEASEALHIGDQPEIDIAGALAAGIQPILLDRFDLFPDVTVCPRIHSLYEVRRYIIR